MNIWFLHAGETVPLDGDVRLFRYGQMCRLLASQGHSATQWACGFNHFTKQHRCRKPESHTIEPGYQVELLPVLGYRHHIGISRILSHRNMAAGFSQRAPELPQPDVIVASLPTLENCLAALKYGEERGIPVLVDVRDLWPDAFLTPVPKFLRPLAKPFLWTFERQAREICERASALIGVSQEYLDWGLAKADREQRPTDRVIHHAFETPPLTTGDEAALAAKWEPLGLTTERKLRVCYFGTLGRSAGIGVLAKTARWLVEAGHMDVEFVICGGGPRERELRQAVDGLPNVILPGWVNQQEVAWIMSRSDVGFAAYEADVFQSLPNKPIEYLAGGLPVLTTLPGELARLLDTYQCGASFGVSQVADMARWLISCKQSPERAAQFAGNARRLYDEQFDARKVYQEFINYLSEFAAPSQQMRKAA